MRVSRVACEHMVITGDFVSAYCLPCVAETMRTLGCDEPTAKFALALHHGFEDCVPRRPTEASKPHSVDDGRDWFTGEPRRPTETPQEEVGR